jgi:hypothetical protein
MTTIVEILTCSVGILTVGAKTKEHTETMSGFTRSFIAVEEDSTFQLRVRMFSTLQKLRRNVQQQVFHPP